MLKQLTLKSRSGIPAALILVGVLLVCPDADAQVQDRSQQTCINAYQKAAAKLLKTQAVETFRCANFALKGKIANARECIESDLRGKLAKSQAWASAYLSKKCPDLPDYGIATPGDLYEAGRSTPLRLLEDVFGPAISAQLSAPPKAEGLCMRSIIKAYDRLLHANAKTFAQCLKTQLRAGQLTAADPLAEACLAAIEIDARGLREKFTAILDATAAQRCGDFLDPSIFPGECSTSSNAADLTECIASRTDCRSCQLLNESTGSSLDCDVFDNGLADGSCTKRLNPCGDGVLDPGEECDEGAENSDLLPDACRTNCQSARCGDGVVDSGEACDDGDLNQEYAPGTCRTTCVEPTCGDGVIDHGEACDDGNNLDSDFCSNLCQQQNWSAPLLLLVVDFNDTDVNADLPDAEDRWSSLMFGAGNAEGNHYWEEQFGGRFDLQPAQESAGTPNNGVIVAQVTAAAPTGTDRYLVEAENWVPEALDYAASHLDFDSYDTDANGVLENHELAVLVVLNTSWGNLSGAGAQANIPIDHPIAGTGVTLARFARSLHRYGSIGVNLHELGHHVFDLDHFAPPGSHGLMSTGAYGENPAIPVLWGTLGNWGTRPTLMIAFSHMRTGATSPTTPDWSGSTATLALNSVDSGNYNVVRLPIADGYLLVENRQSVGYDASIPFCDGDQGGIFITEVANYIRPLDVANLESRRTSVSYNDAFDLCDAYSLSGRNDSFSYAGYDFSNFSAAGATMTVDVAQNAIERSLDAFKWRWFKKDPEREGYRLWHHAEALVGTPTTIDFAEIPGGDNPGATFPLVLFGYYDTGEMRSLNRPASWTVSTGAPYVTLSKSDVTGGTGTTGTTAIVSISFAEGETCATEALLEAELEGQVFGAQLVNLPCDTGTPTPTPSPTPTPLASPTPTPTPTPAGSPTPTPAATPSNACEDSPMPDWVENGDGTATQCASGLTWEMKTQDASIHDRFLSFTWSTGDPWGLDGTAVTAFLDVLNDVAGGGADCFAGACDWRLPTIEELGGQSSLGAATGGIVDPGAGTCTGSGAGCTTIPGETLPGPYWSSTTSATTSFALVVNFSSGNVQNMSKLNTGFVRAVRP